VAVGVGLTLLAWPFLFQAWLHTDYDRFLWILVQPQPCASFGGMVVQAVWTFAPSLVGIAVLIGVGLARSLRSSLIVGVIVAAAITISLGAFMLLLPTTFARAIGC
jgi:hypothetical protein